MGREALPRVAQSARLQYAISEGVLPASPEVLRRMAELAGSAAVWTARWAEVAEAESLTRRP